jgi:archaellum component FlaC
MAPFDVLSARLSLDTAEFSRGLQQASATARQFAERFGDVFRRVGGDVERLGEAPLKLLDRLHRASDAAVQRLDRPRLAVLQLNRALDAAQLKLDKLGFTAGASRSRDVASAGSALIAGPAAAFNSPTGTTSQAALMGFMLRVNHALQQQAALAERLAEAVAHVLEAIGELAGGEDVQEKMKQAAEKLSEAVEKALDKIKEALDKAKEALDKLKDAVEELTDKAEEAADKVKELGEKAEELGEKAEELGEKSEEADKKVEGLGEKIGELAERSRDAAIKVQGLCNTLNNCLVGLANCKCPAAQGGPAGKAPAAGGQAGGQAGGSSKLSPSQAAAKAKQQATQQRKDAAVLENKAAKKYAAGFMPRGDTLKERRAANKSLEREIRSKQRGSRQALAGLRSTLTGMSAPERAQGQRTIGVIGQHYHAAEQYLQQAMKAEGEQRRRLLMLAQKEYRTATTMEKGWQKNIRTLDGLNAEVKKAGINMKKLDEAEQAKLAHAQGQLTPQQQAAQQQAQKFQQQVGQWIKKQAQQAAQQMGQQAWASGQAMLQQALQGPGQVQAMIDAASKSGDMATAVRLIRQRLEAMLAQSKINLHNLASDPMAGGGFGAAHGGVSNDAYFMTLDIPLVRLIKFLQAQLDHLPKFAAGGVFTRPTAGLVGEAGPEAVLPLSSFGNMLANLPVFSDIHSAIESLSDSLAAQGQTAMADRWDRSLERIQSTFEYVASFLDNSRRIDLQPRVWRRPGSSGLVADQPSASDGASAPVGGLSTGDLALHFHGVDIANPGAARSFAQRLLPALDDELRRRGRPAFATGSRAFGYAR